MAGQRRAVYVSIPMGPGILSNTSGRAAKVRQNYMTWDRWKDGSWVRWHKLLPEKQGGWQYQALNDSVYSLPATYLGVARGLHDWASLDGQFWVAIGTHLKLYVVNNGVLYDITPIRATSNLNNAIQTSAGSHLVTITDYNHMADTGDFIDIIGGGTSSVPLWSADGYNQWSADGGGGWSADGYEPSGAVTGPGVSVGGLVLSGSYQITVIDPNTYTIYSPTPATSSTGSDDAFAFGVSGFGVGAFGGGAGGNFTINYEMYTGLPQNGQLLGYGTGTYGEFEYGTPRPVGDGVPFRMRTWSVDNYGEDLIASESDGEIYWWQKINGPNSPAVIIANAPQNVQRLLVDAAQRVLIALGCTDVTSAYDPMLVRWCTLDDITTWAETDTDTAGDYQLTAGSRIVTGLKTKGQNLIWTDTTLYRMTFVGGIDIYDFYPAGQCQIVGPNAACDVDGVAYFMAFDNIYNYSGTLNLQALDVWTTVFDPNVPTSLLRSQAEKVFCYSYEQKSEVTWVYPSIGGVQQVTFLSAPQQEATSGTLSEPWDGESGTYAIWFSDQEYQPVTLVQGSSNASWPTPLTGPVTVNAQIGGECDRYVTFNWEDGTAYCGAWNRTAAQGRAPAMGGYPYGVNNGYLYQHEIGTDAVEVTGTYAIPWFMESLDITVGGAKSEFTMGGSDARFAIGGSDAHLRVVSMIPDFVYMTGEMNIYLSTKDRPRDSDYVINGPVAFDEDTVQIDISAHGSQIVMRFDNLTEPGGQPSLGSSFRMGVLQALAAPYAKR